MCVRNAEVLGRLLVAHQTLDALPGEEQIASFIAEAMLEVPGVESAHLCIDRGFAPPGASTGPCENWAGAGGLVEETAPAPGPFRLAVSTHRQSYGYLLLMLSDAAAFAPYLDILQNTARAIAVTLENRRHVEELTRANSELANLRRELEVALNNSGAIQRSVVAVMAEGVCFHNSKGEIIAANPAAAKIHGCTIEEMTGRMLHSPPPFCVHEDGTPFPGDLHPSAVALRTGEPQNGAVMGLRKPDGAVTWISINAQPLVREGQPRPYAAVTTFRDITAQKRAEDELVKASDELDRFFSVAPDLLCIISGDGHFLRLNKAWERTLGYTLEEMTGRAVVDFIHPDDVEKAITGSETLPKQEGSAPIVTRYRCKGGSYRWFEWNATASGGRIFAAARDITQRKQTEEELDRFFTIVPDLLSIASGEGYFLRLNPAWEATLGHSREELMRSHFLDFVHPDDMAATRKAMTVLATRKELINFTNRFRCKDGSYRWFEWAATGANQQGYAAARDITERKHAQNALELALQVGHIGSFEVNLATGRGLWTPELKEIWGFPDDFDGESDFHSFCWNHTHRADLPRVKEEFARILTSNEAGEIEFRIVRPDGAVRWIRWLGKAVQDHPEGPRRVFGVNMDITRRKRTDGLANALNKINAKIHATVDVNEFLRHAAAAGAEALGCEAAVIAMCQDDGMFITHASGFTADVTGKHLRRHEDAHPRKALATRQPVAVNDAFNDPDVNAEQMRRWGVRASLIVPLATTTQSIGALFFNHRRPGIAFDQDDLDFARKLTSALSLALENARLWEDVQRELAERAHAEAALQELNAELEGRVAERTAQLVQAQKLEALGKLTGGVAHDFNNLLAVILGNMELLRKRVPFDTKSLRLVDNALQGAARGALLTQRMLAFARRQELRSGPVDLVASIAELMPVLRSSLGPAIEIETRFGDGLWPAWADKNQLELALLNLAVNARDAMPDGGLLTFAASNEAAGFANGDLAEGDYVRLAVMDSGVGMDEETLACAADPFFTTKGSDKGTGLGLSVVQGLAGQLGGCMKIASRPGAGTTVSLWLPRAAEMSEVAAPAQPGSAWPGPACRVLVVDDDELMCMATADMLKDLGHQVKETRSGREALDLLTGGAAVDAVLTDYAMRGMTGLELAREIRARWPGLPVLLATGYADLPGGAATDLPRLNKPFDQKTLAEAISRVMPGRG